MIFFETEASLTFLNRKQKILLKKKKDYKKSWIRDPTKNKKKKPLEPKKAITSYKQLANY